MKKLTNQTALPFSLSGSDGRNYRLDDFKGHWLLMVFHRHLG